MTKAAHKKKPIISTSEISRELVRVGKYLNEITSVTDKAGNLLYKTTKPLMVEVYLRDVLQQIVGATLLAIPLAYTEEVWRMGETLPWVNVVAISVISMFFISLFFYYNFYASHGFKKHWPAFVKRLVSTYIVSLLVSFLILSLVDQISFSSLDVGIKRMVLVSLPASLSAAIADMVK